jgi:hypothetical protein
MPVLSPLSQMIGKHCAERTTCIWGTGEAQCDIILRVEPVCVDIRRGSAQGNDARVQPSSAELCMRSACACCAGPLFDRVGHGLNQGRHQLLGHLLLPQAPIPW